MNLTPLVSIITPTYNQGQFIEATIQSVLAQTYPNIEYIVIDAMSTDGTATILENYSSRISKVIREPDKGQSDAIIKGFKMAQGELVGWINSDDLLYPNCVESIVNSLRDSPEAVLFYQRKIDIISEQGSFLRMIEIPEISASRLLRENTMLIQPGSFYSKKTLKKCNYFDGSLRFSMDLDLWLRLLKIGSAVEVTGEPIAAYREWDGTKTSTGDTKLLKERKKMLVSHGAKFTDKTIRSINFSLFKCFLRNFFAST